MTNRSEIDFLEPNLAFAKVAAEGSSVVIRVIFGLEALPPSDDDGRTQEPGGRGWLDFSLTPELIREASGDLRAQMEALEGERWPLGRRDARG